jgi:hypothetical protein
MESSTLADGDNNRIRVDDPITGLIASSKVKSVQNRQSLGKRGQESILKIAKSQPRHVRVEQRAESRLSVRGRLQFSGSSAFARFFAASIRLVAQPRSTPAH